MKHELIVISNAFAPFCLAVFGLSNAFDLSFEFLFQFIPAGRVAWAGYKHVTCGFKGRGRALAAASRREGVFGVVCADCMECSAVQCDA